MTVWIAAGGYMAIGAVMCLWLVRGYESPAFWLRAFVVATWPLLALSLVLGRLRPERRQ